MKKAFCFYLFVGLAGEGWEMATRYHRVREQFVGLHVIRKL